MAHERPQNVHSGERGGGVAVPVTIRTLVAQRSLDLRLRAGSGRVDRPVRWVHLSELADPTPFLEGGELLLTTGLALRDSTSAEYVDRLAAAGVVGLGLGTGLGHDRVPAELVAAAEGAGLALVEVPRPTPFIAISRFVAAAVAADEYAAVSRSAAMQQELARAALAPGAPATVLERLVREVGGWALLIDAVGTLVEAAPRAAGSRVAVLRPELDRLRAAHAPASAALMRPEETVLVQSLGAGPRIRGFLAVGRSGTIPAPERHVVNTAALVLTLRLEQSRRSDSAMETVRTALLRLLVAGQVAAVADVVEELGGRLPAEPLAVLVVHGPAGRRSAAVDVLADVGADERAAIFAAELDDALVLLLPASGPLAVRLPALAERLPGVVLGTAGPLAWPQLAEGIRQAREAAEYGGARAHGVTAFADLATPGLTGLLDPAATRAFAEAVLAPLVAADRAGPGELVASLRVWLAHHGQWEPAAAQLQVHRHTLRKRIRRAADLLGRDVDQPGTRAELWVALHPPT
jgi:PucR family transcriptional regulator, purine catabolism regulatory protein